MKYDHTQNIKVSFENDIYTITYPRNKLEPKIFGSSYVLKIQIDAKTGKVLTKILPHNKKITFGKLRTSEHKGFELSNSAAGEDPLNLVQTLFTVMKKFGECDVSIRYFSAVWKSR